MGKHNKILTAEDPFLVRLLFIHSFIHTFTQKHLFIDFLSSGAVRSLDKATEDLSGEVTYPRSHGSKTP